MSIPYARICYLFRLRSGGLWGSGRRYLEADVVTVEQKYGDKIVPCIPHTYVKGLIRRTLERLEPLLIKAGIISRTITRDLFGFMPSIERSDYSKPSVLPSKIICGPALPIPNVSVAEELSKLEPMNYISSKHILDKDSIAYYVEPHVRILDSSHRVSIGGLFHEYKVAPLQIFYGEILVYEQERALLIEYCRAILVSLVYLNYLYVGRATTTADVAIINIKPNDLIQDPVISQIFNERNFRRMTS